MGIYQDLMNKLHRENKELLQKNEELVELLRQSQERELNENSESKESDATAQALNHQLELYRKEVIMLRRALEESRGPKKCVNDEIKEDNTDLQQQKQVRFNLPENVKNTVKDTVRDSAK